MARLLNEAFEQTQLIKKAFQHALLGASEQGAAAQWLLDELASERLWNRAFAGSVGSLKQLATKALQERHDGNTNAFGLGAR